MTRRPPRLTPEDTPLPDPEDPVPVKHRIGHVRDFTPDNPISTDPDPNDVFTLRKVNCDQDHDQDKVLGKVNNSAKRRHWRDYWLVMILGNGLLGCCAWIIPGIITQAFAAAGMIVLTLGLTWLYAFVLDPR